MKILFGNYAKGDSRNSLWGFAAYFEQFKPLFDTGSNGRVLFIKYAMGGFHLLHKEKDKIDCTGDLAVALFSKAYGEAFLYGGVGNKVRN